MRTGMPGDKIQVKAGILFVNDQPAYVSPSSQIDYLVANKRNPFQHEFLKDELEN